MVAAGIISKARVYAGRRDPFCLPKRLRYLALARYGKDLDDDASHSRAAVMLTQVKKNYVKIPRPQGVYYVRGSNVLLAEGTFLLHEEMEGIHATAKNQGSLSHGATNRAYQIRAQFSAH